MEFNWGTGITIFFSVFVVTLVTIVIKTTQHDHSLVMEKYYEEDLKYQTQFNKLANTQALEVDLKISNDAEAKMISFHFPKGQKNIVGKVLFFKPDNKSMDNTMIISIDENNMFTTSSEGFAHGRWKVKVDWGDGEKAYYKEIALNL